MSEEFGFHQLLSFGLDDDEEVARELTSPRADSSDSTSLNERRKKLIGIVKILSDMKKKISERELISFDA